jgi:hypothetical protein
MHRLATLLIAIALSAWLSACSPALDWREMSPSGSGLVLRIPCKPAQQARPASATGPAMGMAVCEAAGYRFSVAWADMDGPERLSPALTEMPRTLAAKLGQALAPLEPLAVPGATPMPQSGVYRFAPGPSGGATRLAVFAKGLRVYQLILQGVQDDTEVWRTFVEGLRVTP